MFSPIQDVRRINLLRMAMRTADMSSSIGECHLSEAVLIYVQILRWQLGMRYERYEQS
jgi:hypothetical protein